MCLLWIGPPVEAAYRLLRRSRRAFAVAFACHGAMSAIIPGAFRDRTNKVPDCLSAATFSLTIRAYSAGGQMPRAISKLRRAIVSHEPNASSNIVMGRRRGGRPRLLICLAPAGTS